MGSVNHLRQPGPLGQLPFDSYTVICLGFELNNDRRTAASDALDHASLKLTAAFPWLAGQVVIEGERSDKKSGHYAIVPYLEDGQSVVSKQDRTESFASYDKLIAAKAPFSMLDAQVLCPVSPMGYNMSRDIPWPVLVIQATFINNGIILCFALQHSAGDMTAQGRIIQYFAQALRGETFDPKDVLEGNRVPPTTLLPEDQPFTPPPRMIRPSQLHLTYPTPLPPPNFAPWNLWRISAANAAELKSLTKAHSTNDAIAALYAQRLTDARVAAGLLPKDTTVTIDRAMNIRAQLGYPESYLGSAPGSVETTIRPHDSLVQTAKSLRQALDSIDADFATRFATLAERAEDKTTVFYGAETKMGHDIVISSWAKLPLATTKFGEVLGGEPGFVRRPRFGPAPEICYILPKTREGDWEVAASSLPEHAGALNGDGEWRGWVEVIE